MAQYKDPAGTIAILQYYETARNDHELKLVAQIQTQYQGFTTFDTALLTAISPDAYIDHICIVTPCFEDPHFPKFFVLNVESNAVLHEQTLEVLPNSSNARPGVEGGSTQEGEEEAPKDNREGNITCILVNDRPMPDDLKLKSKEEHEDIHEVFLGYESGAIGMFTVHLSRIEGAPIHVEHHVQIAPQRVMADKSTRHVLTMLPIYVDPKSPTFKLAVGFYAKYIQIFDLMQSSVGESYVFMDQKRSDATYHEKPGISCLSAAVVKKNRQVLVQGGFDFRIRLFSAKTLKLLVNMKFHQNIVNQVYVERDPQNEDRIDIYSCSEDCYLAHWNLEV